MSPNVDVVRALELLSQLEPELQAHGVVVPFGTASPGDGDALDRALRAGLARLRVEIGRETFIYLRWRAERARGDEELCQLLTRDDAVSDERPEAPRAQ